MTIVFSSSESSDSDDIRVVPRAKFQHKGELKTSSDNSSSSSSSNKFKIVNANVTPTTPNRQPRPPPKRSGPQRRVIPSNRRSTPTVKTNPVNDNDGDTPKENKPQEVKRPIKPKKPENTDNNDNVLLVKSPSIEHDDSDDDVIMAPQSNSPLQAPDTSISPIQSPHASRQLSITFSIERKAKTGKYSFIMRQDSHKLLFAKCKSRHPSDSITVYQFTNNSNNREKTNYKLFSEKKCRQFILKSNIGTLMTFSITLPTKLIVLPRQDIKIEDIADFKPKHLKSKNPQMSQKGYWVLDFHSKFTIPSEKNAIFISAEENSEGEDLILVRKIEKNRLEVDVNLPDPNAIIIFGIALSIFMAKYK